jgi:DDE family transposase
MSQDRGYESLLWVGALHAYAARFVLRWRHEYRLLFEGKLKAAWKIAQGKKAWGSRGLWDARRRTWISASVLAFAVRHPELPLWLVVARRKGSTPWYLLTSEPVHTEAQAWKVVLAYARRWQIELAWKTCKCELAMQSPRVWDWETRLKLLGLATLAYAFLLHLLSEPFALLRRWLFRYAAHSHGTTVTGHAGPSGALAAGRESAVVGPSPSLQSTRRSGGLHRLTSGRCCQTQGSTLPRICPGRLGVVWLSLVLQNQHEQRKQVATASHPDPPRRRLSPRLGKPGEAVRGASAPLPDSRQRSSLSLISSTFDENLG